MAAYALTDHDQIQRWAEARGARPACVKRTGGEGDVGIIRLDFPGFSGEDTLETIDWNAWFDKFERQNLALLVDEAGTSNFNKLVRRADDAPDARRSAAGAHSADPGGDAADADEESDEDVDDEDADLEDDLDEDDDESDLDDEDEDDFDEDEDEEEDAADDEEEDKDEE